jgi:ATP-dependent RNA/DNA helicase IGHMBP2
MTYFGRLLDLLKIERSEDRTQYLKLTETTSVADRRASGLVWYPIAIRGTEMGRGDYLIVEAERTTHQDVFHQMRNGMPAVLFSNHNAKEDKLEGTISFQQGNRLKITLRTDELPQWSRDGKLGIELLFDDNSYDEMQNALKSAEERYQEKEELTRVLIGEKTPSFQPITSLQGINSGVQNLNLSQQRAVQQILLANELTIVHGPPGTGKTTTLVQAIKAMSVTKAHEKILVVAPSNAAVDLLAEKLSQEGLRVLRVGNPSKVSDHLMGLTLEAKMAGHDRLKEAKKLKKQAQEFKNMAHKYKRNFGRAESEQRKALFEEAHRIMKEVVNTEQYIIDSILGQTQVVAATLVGANHYTVRGLRYHTVVIDEAGQALEPACWIPILKAQKVVLVGDHCQLPPTIKSEEAARNGLSITLLEKTMTLFPEAVTLLDEQYRMNSQIMAYSSRVFYQGLLKAHASVAQHTLFKNDLPLLFIDTAGCGFEEKLEGTSSTNPEEAVLLFKHLSAFLPENFSAASGQFPPSVAIISPYKQQIAALKEQLAHCPALKDFERHIDINTIDSFQGQERDVVYISLVRSNTRGDIGFLNDIRRMNVAMTRARKKLVVVGDSATLGGNAFYGGFIEYAQELPSGYLSAWELMD